MYKNILVSVDNSIHSEYAEDIGLALSRKYNATIHGLHVYSGKFHQLRFNKLENFLPDKYQVEAVLDYQRKIHSVLIERGLEIISLEYMKRLQDKCIHHNVCFEERLVDGKNADKISQELQHNDVLVIGAQGLGEITNYSRIGSNTRRVLRNASKDIFITKKPCDFSTILVGIDGSEYSFQIFKKTIDLASKFDSTVTVVSSFDPVFHRNVFSLLTNVLSGEAGKVFKFNEQQELHNLVIDKSLENLYKHHLTKAKEIAEKKGISVETELLRGKPYYSLYMKAQESNPDLIVVGRFGMHKGPYDTIGSNAENIAELADTNVLILTTSSSEPSVQKMESDEPKTVTKIEKNVTWNKEAKNRLEHIPKFARPMAILAIERYAKEKGEQIITPEIMKKARERL